MDVATLGQGLLTAGGVAALIQMCPLSLRQCAWAARVQGAAVCAAFLVLIYLHAVCDFSVQTVFMSTQLLLPLQYRISAAWSHHEGSMLLWTALSSLCGVLIAQGSDAPAVRHKALRVHAAIGVAFVAFLIFTSDPFARLFPVPADGGDLNPLLQDIGLIVHPPLLYCGYVACGGVFAVAAAALLLRDARVPLLRRYTAGAWLFLTAGIIQGSAWAYYELGWGGYWFWDLVENAALLPWLLVTALLHAVSVAERSGALARQTQMCAIGAFIAALLGTFLVRSGVITSVHAFASAPGRGIFVLALLLGFGSAGVLLYARRTPPEGPPLRARSRRGLIVLNTLLLSAACATVLLGTLYPAVVEAFGGARLSIGAPYYAATVAPMMMLLAVLMPLAPLLPFRRSTWLMLVAVTAGALGTICVFYRPSETQAWLGLLVGAWTIGGTLLHMKRTLASGRPAAPAMWAAHIGFGLLIWGIVGTNYGERKAEAALRLGEVLRAGDHRATLVDVRIARGPNYAAEKSTLRIDAADGSSFYLTPERRIYVATGRMTAEAAIRHNADAAVYANVGDAGNASQILVRMYVQPLTWCLKAGAMLLTLAGVLHVWQQRRRRVAQQ